MSHKIEITNASDVANDVSSLINHIASLTSKDKEWLSKVFFREIIKSKHYVVLSQDESATYVSYVGSQAFLDNARYIVDWLAGLQERDPKQHSKLSRITFQQALGHSKKWHAELAKKSEKSERYIEPDAENAPKVLDLGEGWEVFWLKTDAARDVEGEVMGHCVGSGAYDDLRGKQGVFSIRKNNVVHITLHMEELRIKQAVTKGNVRVPERYQYLVNEAAAVIGAKLFLEYPLENQSPIPNGWHENSNGSKACIKNGLVNSKDDKPAVILRALGMQEWYENGRRHRVGGPAVILDKDEEWWFNGRRHREDGPAVIGADGLQEWYVNGKLHREDGPAVIHPDGSHEWYENGLLHCLNCPSVVCADGSQIWYMNGKRHREDGPAAIWEDGTQEWWLNDKKYTEETFNDIIKNATTSPIQSC